MRHRLVQEELWDIATLSLIQIQWTFMSSEATEPGVTRLELELWHPCWSLGVTEHSSAGLLGYGSADTLNGRRLFRNVVYGDTVSEVEEFIEEGRRSSSVCSIHEANAMSGKQRTDSQPGNAVKEVITELCPSASSIGEAFLSRGFVRSGPYIVTDGIERWSLLTSCSRSEIGAGLDEIREQEDADMTLIRISQTADSGIGGNLPLGRLSARQYEVFDLARRRGYYAHPRKTTPQELADDLEITTSTFHEHLHKTEEKLLDLS